MISVTGILKCTTEMESDQLSKPSKGFLHSGGGGGWTLLLAWPPKFVSFRCFGQSQLVFGLKFKYITTSYTIKYSGCSEIYIYLNVEAKQNSISFCNAQFWLAKNTSSHIICIRLLPMLQSLNQYHSNQIIPKFYHKSYYHKSYFFHNRRGDCIMII